MFAAAMSALILTALAMTSNLFAGQVAYANDNADDTLEKVSNELADLVRSAWVVTQPNSTSLSVETATGEVTAYSYDNGALTVTRPSGASGVLVDNLATFDIMAQTTARYREAPEIDVEDTWWTTSGGGLVNGMVLQPGEAVGVGFFVSAEAPVSVNQVEGVQERRLSATINDLALMIDKIDLADHQFWHLYDDPPNGSTPIGDLKATLYESRGPGNAIPYGPALAQRVSSLDNLPTNGYYWIEETTGETIEPPQGAAYGWWKNHPDVGLIVTIPTSGFTIDLSDMGAVIEPGRSYVLTLETEGYGAIALFTRTSSSGTEATSYSPNTATTSFQEIAYTVPFSLAGTSTYTQTEAHDVIRQVSVTLARTPTRSLTASAAVLSQTGIDDPWLGAVPGEAAEIEVP